MAVINVTNGTGGYFVPEMWAKEVEWARDNAYVVANLVERKHEDAAEYGKLVHVPFLAKLPVSGVQSVTPGTPLTPVAATDTEVQILLNKNVAQAVQISDIAKTQAKYDLAPLYGKAIGDVLAAKIDTDVLSELRSGATNTAIDGTTGATYANIVSLVSGLDVLNVPLDDRSFVVNGKMMGDLRQMAEFTRYDAVGEKNPSTAQTAKQSLVGFIYGIPVYMTNNVEVVAGAPAKDWNWLFHKSAVGLVVQKAPKMEHDRTSLNLADDIVGSVIYGVKTLRPNHSIALKRN
jgi:N4-gp56 family major capsid protein